MIDKNKNPIGYWLEHFEEEDRKYWQKWEENRLQSKERLDEYLRRKNADVKNKERTI